MGRELNSDLTESSWQEVLNRKDWVTHSKQMEPTIENLQERGYTGEGCKEITVYLSHFDILMLTKITL